MIRFLDIFFSAVGLLILAPMLLPIMLVLRVTGEGKIFYVQSRVGIRGQTVRVYKFATMLENSLFLGAGSITEKNDPRILPVGRFLRKSKINELPQLLNVLNGSMSLVGPRPHVMRDLQSIPLEVLEIIQSVPPGVTGLGSIVFKDEEFYLHQVSNGRELYDEVIAPYKATLEVWFCQNRSPKIYFLLLTVTMMSMLGLSRGLIWKLIPELPALPETLAQMNQKRIDNR